MCSCLASAIICRTCLSHACVDEALHYGQKLRIIANPMCQGECLDGLGGTRPLYLYSRPVGTTHFAKLSRHQLVAFTDRASYDSVWQVSLYSPLRIKSAVVYRLSCAMKA